MSLAVDVSPDGSAKMLCPLLPLVSGKLIRGQPLDSSKFTESMMTARRIANRSRFIDGEGVLANVGKLDTWMRLMPAAPLRVERGGVSGYDQRLIRLPASYPPEMRLAQLVVCRVAELPAAEVDGLAAGVIDLDPFLVERGRGGRAVRAGGVVHDLADDHVADRGAVGKEILLVDSTTSAIAARQQTIVAETDEWPPDRWQVERINKRHCA